MVIKQDGLSFVGNGHICLVNPATCRRLVWRLGNRFTHVVPHHENLHDETHRALKLRASQHRRSTEVEMRYMLEGAVQPKAGLGTALAVIGRGIDGLELDIRRDSISTEAAVFE